MARTTHLIRSSACCRCGQGGATQRCPSCGGAYYCQASGCQSDDACSHKAVCEAVRSAQQTAACRAPTAAEAAALTNFVTVMDFQMSLPPLEEADAAVPSGCGLPVMDAGPAAYYPAAHQQQLAAVPEPDSPAVIRADIFDAAVPQQAPPQLPGADWQALRPYPPASECAPPQASGEGAAEFLAQRTEALEAVVDWLVSQAPCLLSRPAADLLLAHAIRLRDDGQCCELHLLAWAILDRCLTAGVQQFQDALTLQHSCFSDWAVDCGAHSPRQVSGLPLISKTASAVLDTLTPVSVAVHADHNAFMSPLEIPPMML